MKNSNRDELDLATVPDVITSCDCETCPTVKSSAEGNGVIVVKSDGSLHSIEAGSNHGDDGHYESLENGAVGVQL